MSRLLLLRVATRPFATLAPFHAPRSSGSAREIATLEAQVDAAATIAEAALHRAAGPPDAHGVDPGTRNTLLAVRRDVHNRRMPDPAAVAVAAAKLDDPEEAALRSLVDASARRDRLAASWEVALVDDLAAGRRALVEAVRDPLVQEGIALASRSLLGKLRALRGDDPSGWGHGERHVAAKALAYVARFATKTSPNAVFCATAIAGTAPGRASVGGGAVIARRDILLSVAEARKVACTLAADPALEAAVRPRVNPTLRETDGALTFWKFASARHPTDDETLARVKDHPVLRAVLREIEALRPSLAALRSGVAREIGIDEAALDGFLRQMIDRGVLIAEIEIPYHERRPLRFVAEAARGGCAEPAAIEQAVDGLPHLPLDERLREMSRIARALEALPRSREIKVDELFRVDAASGLSVTVPDELVEGLRSDVAPYVALFGAMYPASSYISGWVSRFLKHYPAGQDVALLDVYRTLREEGEAYRPAAFPEPSEADEAAPPRVAMRAVRDHLERAARTAAPGEETHLDASTLGELLPAVATPRWAAGVLFQIAAADAGAIAAGRYRTVLNGLFHGAGLSLSRFAFLLGGPSEDASNPIVRELARAWSVVEREGAVVAELTYNHLGRTANAGLRPPIFPYEIELPGDKGSARAATIPLTDLVVRWDPAASRFVLRSLARGVEVVPVVNSGVNPVGFISFLVAIGEQGLQPISYLPGFDHPEIVRWPRVVSGRLVLFRERWTFRPGAFPAADARGDALVAFAREAARWRSRHAIPRHVFVHTSVEPKPRYRDLESPLFLDLLRRDVAALPRTGDATLHVTEMLPGPGDLWLTVDGAGHASELLVQLNG